VVTHEAPAESPEGGVYTFVTDGIESALEQAKAVADGKIVTVMGGASIGQQYIAAGLIDEISIRRPAPALRERGQRLRPD
jgi:dihydrofolate reductase